MLIYPINKIGEVGNHSVILQWVYIIRSMYAFVMYVEFEFKKQFCLLAKLISIFYDIDILLFMLLLNYKYVPKYLPTLYGG